MASVGGVDPARRIGLIKHVSPSRAAVLLACRLSEAFQAADGAPRLPTHPNAHFGILAHDFLRDASRGYLSKMSEADLRTAWRASVRSYEEFLGRSTDGAAVLPLTKSCDDFEVNSLRLIKSVEAYVARIPPAAGNMRERQRVEVEAISRDGMIAGRLDRISWENGELVVTDIKTGKIKDADGGLRRDLRLQIMLYSYLLHEMFGRWPQTLRVLPLHGEPIEVTALPSEIIVLADWIKQALKEANWFIAEVLAGRRPESELASPSPNACRFCRFRLTCEAYWAARNQDIDQSWPRDVTGRVTAIKPLGRGLNMAELMESTGRTLVIRGVPTTAHTAEQYETSIRVCGLKAERAAGVYSWCPTSFSVSIPC